MTEIITYETIRKLHRAEKEETLKPLPENFFNAINAWLKHKESQKDTTSLLEVESTKKLLEDLINRRERKIVIAALRVVRGDTPPKNLTKEEQELFDQVVSMLKTFHKELQESIFSISKEEIKKEQVIKESKKVKILVDMQRFIGSDLKQYGPMKGGDIAVLPADIAELLITREVAEAIK